jgi:hypothetical protein
VPVAGGDPSADVLTLVAGGVRVPVVLGGEELWFGGDLASAVRRAGAPRPGPPPSSAVCTVLAGQVVRYLLRLLVGAGDDALHVVALPSLHTSVHRVVPFPEGGPELPVTERVAALAAAPRVSDEEFARRVMSLCDSRFGIFGDLGEGDLTQVPVAVSSASVADPYGRAGLRPVVYGHGQDIATSRRRAAMAAVARYAALARDPAGPVRVAGVRLTDGEVRMVPAASAFPVAEWPGVAAGSDWPEALGRALLGMCRTLLPAATDEALDVPGLDEDPAVTAVLPFLVNVVPDPWAQR